MNNHLKVTESALSTVQTTSLSATNLKVGTITTPSSAASAVNISRLMTINLMSGYVVVKLKKTGSMVLKISRKK